MRHNTRPRPSWAAVQSVAFQIIEQARGNCNRYPLDNVKRDLEQLDQCEAIMEIAHRIPWKTTMGTLEGLFIEDYQHKEGSQWIAKECVADLKKLCYLPE